MKTWEMIKELTENPKLEFKNGIHVVKISKTSGRVVWDNMDGEDPFVIYNRAPGNVDNLHIDWELVPTEVTWQEAIQAWVDGKNVYFILDGIRHDVSDRRFLRAINIKGQEYPVCKRIFVIGKWYIG